MVARATRGAAVAVLAATVTWAGLGCSDESPDSSVTTATAGAGGAAGTGSTVTGTGGSGSGSGGAGGGAPVGGGTLVFASGFEASTSVSDDLILGVDSTGPPGANDWEALTSYLPWLERANGFFEGGWMGIAEDPLDPTNRVLHFHNQQIVNDRSRTQWSLKQVDSWTDPGGPNLFDRQFYRYRMLIPTDTRDLYTTNEHAPWYMVWESHVWESENTRHGIYLKKESNQAHWYLQVMQQRPQGGTILWENTGQQDIAVPFGEWFQLDVLFAYDDTDGEFYVAMTKQGEARQVLGHYVGATKFDTKLRDQMVFKMYHHPAYLERMTAAGLDGTHQYYDDFEIWSDYPPGYSP